MKKCELCDCEILENETHINENNSNVCCNCVLSFHKIGLENDLLSYGKEVSEFIKSIGNQILLLV